MSTIELNVLTKEDSLKYYEDKLFRNEINSINKNISLDLSGCDNIFDTEKIKSAHTLNISGCENIKNISNLNYVCDLNLETHTEIVSGICNTKQYHNLRFLSKIGFLNDSITCRKEKVIHFNNFNSMRKLNLSGCKKVKDIGYLRKLEELTITTEIRDIHLLINLKKLSINKDCNNIMKRRINKLKKINPDVEIIFI